MHFEFCVLHSDKLEVSIMKLYTVAVLGATGAVGQEMMNILAERNFPVGKLIPLASARSAGKTFRASPKA